MKNLPWGIILMSIAIAFFWRPIFPEGQDGEYILSCLFSGVVLGLISGWMKLREDRNEK